MSRVFEVTEDDIESLDFKELTYLLRKLLYLETSYFRLPPDTVFVSLNIHASDSGEDARVEWENSSVDRTDWIPCSPTLFQSKATSMNRGDCKSEMLTEDGSLKRKVEEVLDQDGAYRLFCSGSLGGDTRSNCIEGFREALEEAGKDYAQEVDIKVYDAEKISEWVNKYLNAIIFVHDLISKPLKTSGFINFEQWVKEREHNMSEYQSNRKLEEIQEEIIEIISDSNSAVRLLGLSGVGKTRLVMNAFEQTVDDHPLEFSLEEYVVYTDASKVNCDLVEAVQNWRLENSVAILIVDNCDLKTHKNLVEEVLHEDSSLSLLTIHLDPDEKTGGPEPVKILKPSDNEENDVIQTIVSNRHPELSDRDLDKIIEFAQDFPKIAVLLAEARFDEDSRMGSLDDDVMVRKLLCPDENEDEIAEEVLSVCSLFEYVGFEGEPSEHRKKLAENICDRLPSDNSAGDLFYEKITPYKRRGIVEEVGDYIRVGPVPLAIRLAADWWDNCSPEKADRLLSEIPPGLHKPLCDRMAKLDFLPKAQKFVSDLCGEMSPFGQAEVLNSEQGSRLFRSLVEVNPEATSDCLINVFGDKTREDLLEVGPGRRNLIWALEKICFRRETFWPGVYMMFRFAAAENENIANNATGKFIQLFCVLLSGTQASLEERLHFIKENIKTEIKEEKELLIEAMGEGLRSGHFTRYAGAEEQGSGPALEEYHPNNKEIHDYWVELLNLLEGIALSENMEAAEKAKKVLAERFRDHTSTFLFQNYVDKIESVNEQIDDYWTEMNKVVTKALTFWNEGEKEEKKDILIELSEKLGPTNLAQKINVIVKEGIVRIDRDDRDDRDDWEAAREESEKLGEKVDRATDIKEFLPILCVGDVKHGFSFGKGLAKNIGCDRNFILEVLETLKENKENERNTNFIRGYLAELRNENAFVDFTLKKVKEDDEIVEIYPDLLRVLEPDLEELNWLIKLPKEKKLPIKNLKTLSVGRPFEYLSEHDFKIFLRNLSEELGVEGARIALEFSFYYTYKIPKRFSALEQQFKNLLTTPNLLNTAEEEEYFLDAHRWQTISEEILKRDPNEDFVSDFVDTIAESLTNKDSMKKKHALEPIIRRLFREFPEISWQKISRILITSDPIEKITLRSLLGNEMSFKNGNWLLDDLPEELIFSWCDEEGIESQEIIAEMAPLFKSTEEQKELEWNPFILEFLNQYGENEKIRKAISRNMMSFGSAGPRSVYYEKRLDAVNKLKDQLTFSGKKSWIRSLNKMLESDKKRESTFEEYWEKGILY